jgi:hypothetical protein
MITEIVFGDITLGTNECDIIIGMNTTLQEVTGIGLNFSWRVDHKKPFALGTVLSFKLDRMRNLHMIICHKLGDDGWCDADKYIRFGLDYLWSKNENNRYYSIVEIGTGRVGQRDGADAAAIRSAIANSWLRAELFVFDSLKPVAIEQISPKVLRAYRCWDYQDGEKKNSRKLRTHRKPN